jgi:hypothetical protein
VILSLHDISTTNGALWRCGSASDLSKEGPSAAFAGRGLFLLEASSLLGSAQLFGGFASPKRVACRMLAVSAPARDQRLYPQEGGP